MRVYILTEGDGEVLVLRSVDEVLDTVRDLLRKYLTFRVSVEQTWMPKSEYDALEDFTGWL